MPYETPSTPAGREWRAVFGTNEYGNNATVVLTADPGALASDPQKDRVFQAALDALAASGTLVFAGGMKTSESYQNVTPTE